MKPRVPAHMSCHQFCEISPLLDMSVNKTQLMAMSTEDKSVVLLLQMFPLALVCGNTFVLKPSERDPGASMILCELARDAGVPNGVLNVIHGAKEGENS